MIDELKIYNGELSPTEITEIYNLERTGNNYDGTVRNCATCPITPNCDTLEQGLYLTTYDTTGYNTYPADSLEYQNLVDTYGIYSNRFGKGVVNEINGTGNPYGTDSNYLSIFEGFIKVPTDGLYSFAVDGDDAVEVLIDGIVITGWYGAHGRCNCTTHNGSVNLTAGYHSVEFRQQERTGQDNYYLYWKKPGDTDYSIVPSSVYYHCPPPAPIAEYRFDDCEWTGLTGEVTDETGNADGTITGSVTAGEQGLLCRGASFSGGAIDLDGLAVDTSAGARTTVTFWMYWDGTNSVMPFGWYRHDLWFVNGFFGFNTGAGDVYGISSSGLANGWHHVTAVFVNGSVHSEKLYIDGVEQSLSQLRNNPNNYAAVVSGSARIGGWRINTGYRFRTMIDELKIYNGELERDTVEEIYNRELAGENASGSARFCGLCNISDVCDNPVSGLTLSTYDTTGYNTYPADHAEYVNLINSYATPANLFGSAIVDNVDGVGNPFGSDDYYLSVFEGYINLPVSGVYSFAVDGDDAVEVLIDGVVVASWYGAHGRCNCTDHFATIEISAGYHTFEFHQQERTGADNYYFYWKKPGDTDYSIVPSSAFYHCPPPEPIADYRMDECEWNGTPGEVIDYTGNGHDGTAFGSATVVLNGKLCRGGEFNLATNDDYVVLDNNLINGANDFTYCGWYKTVNTGTQALISGANSTSTAANGWLLWQTNDTRLYTYIDNSSRRYDLPYSIADGNWHFIVWTRENDTEKLYLDGSIVDSHTVTTDSINVEPGGLILGQEQDAVGGGFDSGQNYEGQIDEVMFYDLPLNADDILTIYGNYNTNANYDGSMRTCTSCAVEPQCSVPDTGLVRKVYDTTGYNTYPANHAEYENLINTYGTVSNLYGTDVVGEINGTGNPFGSDDYYLTVFKGYIYVDTDGIYTFAVDGDDAVELMIDNAVVAYWYGGHGRCNCTTHSGAVNLTSGYHLIEYRHQERTGGDNYYLYWKKPTDTSFSIVPSSALFHCELNPEADWHFDECEWVGSAGEIDDATGNGNTGYADNGVVNDTLDNTGGVLCKSAVLINPNSSDNQRVVIPYSGNLDVTDTGITILGWIKANRQAQPNWNSVVYSNRNDLRNGNGFTVYLNNYNSQRRLCWHIGPYGTTNDKLITTDFTYDKWTHFAVTYKPNEKMEIYLDGVLVRESSLFVPDLVYSLSNKDIMLGAVDNYGGPLNGYLDEFIVVKRVLEGEDISTIYEMQKAGFNYDGTQRLCYACGVTPDCPVPDSGLKLTTYDTTGYNSYPADHTEYLSLISSYATDANKFGEGIVPNINGSGNPYGTDSYYLSVFKGYLYVDIAGEYSFAVDGDDAVEVLIDEVVVASWYGGHGRCNCTTHNGVITLNQGYHLIEFHQQERTGGDNYYLYWQKPNSSSYEIVPSSVFFNCPETAIVDYRMDECDWEGVAGEVTDSSGYDRNGSVHNNAYPNIDGVLCNSGDLTENNYITPDSTITIDDSWTLTFWAKFPLDETAHTLVSNGYAFVVGSVSGSGDLGYFIKRGNSWNWGVYSNSGTSTEASFRELTGWHHIAFVADTNTTSLYVDGSFEGSVGAVTSGDFAYVGTSSDDPNGQTIGAYVDEYKIFDKPFNQNEIVAIMQNEQNGNNWNGSVRDCAPCVTVSYFEVIHDSTATVCYPETITIVARDVNGQVVTDFTGQISLSTSTGNGTWYASYGSLSNPDSPFGTLTDATADDGFAIYSFVEQDNGQVTLFLRDTHVENLEIMVSNGTVNSTGHNSGVLSFREKGFVITDVSGNPIGSQISGKPFQVMIKAIGIDPDSGNCDILDYEGTHNLSAKLNLLNPTTVGNNFQLNGINISTAGTNISLNFTGGTAVVTANYFDAGAIGFSITDATDTTITGSSNVFVVKPWTYFVDAIGNPKPNSASDSVYAKAGENFTLTISAVCYESGDDTDNDLIPDTSADLSDNTVTVNYSPVDFAVSHTLVLPTGGSSGLLTGVPNSLTNGTVTVSNAQFSEVGIIKITASSNDFLATGDSYGVIGTSDNIGRFYPAELRINDFRQVEACSGVFTYAEQFFNITGTVNALNVSGTVTSNYSDDFAKLTESDISIGVQTGTGSYSLGTFTLNFNNGVSALSISSNRYGWGSPHNAENVVLRLTGTDSDGVNCTSLESSAVVNYADSNIVNFRYGRLNIVNGYSPSDRALTLQVYAEYYKSDEPYRYTLCNEDNCTTFSVADINLFNFKGSLNNGETSVSALTVINSGIGTITLSPPGIGNEGSVDLILTVPYYMNFQSGTAFFGIYRGNDKIISWQEIEK
jgi:MSHA biogenesis protein MshQ